MGHISRIREGTDRRRVQLIAQRRAAGRILGQLMPLFADLDDLSREFSTGEQAVIQRYLRAASGRVQAHEARLGAAPDDAYRDNRRSGRDS